MEETFTETYGGDAVGKNWGRPAYTTTPEDYKTIAQGDVGIYQAKERYLHISALHAVKLLARVLMIVAIIWIIVYTMQNINYVFATASNLLSGHYGAKGLAAIKTDVEAAHFANNENFVQYLGASTNVLRGDNDREVDTLAETAMRRTNQVTDMSKFTSRERMTTPEEELMKKINKN